MYSFNYKLNYSRQHSFLWRLKTLKAVLHRHTADLKQKKQSQFQFLDSKKKLSLYMWLIFYKKNAFSLIDFKLALISFLKILKAALRTLLRNARKFQKSPTKSTYY